MRAKKNKGEWSELYVLLKLLTNGEVPAASSDLKPIPGKFYRFLEVIKDESGELKAFRPHGVTSDGGSLVSQTLAIPPLERLEFLASGLLDEIKMKQTASFEAEHGYLAMKELGIEKVKASSSQKSDIQAVLAGVQGAQNRSLGFSIKSQVGNLSTLLNAGRTTNLIYTIEGREFKPQEVNSIDGTAKLQRRLQKIESLGASLKFKQMENETFQSNLELISENLPKDLAELLVLFATGKGRKFGDLVPLIAASRGGDREQEKIEFRIKGFLRAIALGMVPATQWNARLSTYGGYLVALADGRIVCMHLENDDDFRDYLYSATKLETASTTRHQFGEVYESKGGLEFKLNLQIRFDK